MFASAINKETHVPDANQTKNYNGIDLMKFICAIFVFIIHFPPFPGEVSGFREYFNFGLQHGLCRLAVPFYFVCSGFFLFRKMPAYELNTEAIKRYCFKILQLAGIWHVLLFMGAEGHLWYLGATVIAVILLSICFYFQLRFRYICVLACGFYVIGLLGDSYNGLITPLAEVTVFRYLFKAYSIVFTSTRNGVFMGFIFVLMGVVFSWYEMNLRLWTALTGFIVSLAGLFAEVYLLRHNQIPIDYNMYIFLLPATWFLFAFARALQLKDHGGYKHLRNIGILIYFIHQCVGAFTTLGIGGINRLCDIDIKQYHFMISLLATVAVAVVIEWLSGKEKFKWLNWLLAK